MIKILSSVLATLQIFLSIPIEAQAQVQMQRILQTPVQNLAELQENLSWTQKANECQNTPRGPMGIVFENLFNQLISSIQIITEEIEGHPTKTTEIKFSDAIYNKLGQLQAYQELQQTKVGNEESINLKEVSSLQYSILGLQVGAIESRSEGLNLIHQETKEILNQSYDEAGRLTGDKSKTTLSTGEVIKSQKTNISYDNYGNITSFNESGHSNASGSYSFSRSQTFNALGETTSTAEEGTRSNGGSYQSTETNIIYDELGRKISFKRIEKDSLGKHITDRTSTSFDEQGRVSSYEQTTEDHLSNGHRTSNTEHRTNIQYDAQNRMTKWTSHTWGTNAEGKSFNQTTTTHVLDFDHAGRATQLKESWNNHTEGKSGTNNITQGYNHQGQLAWKEIPDEKGDIAHHTYTYSSSGALEKEEISHPDYIITLDAYGTQQSFKYGPRLAAQIKEAEEQARRAQDQARNAQKAASKAMSIYKKQVTQELLKQAEKIKQQAAIQISKAQQTASQAKSLAQQALRTAQQALQQAQTKIQQAKSTAERAKAEGERKIAQAQVKVAQAKLALLQATTQAAKQAALKALEIAKQELEKIKSQVASVKSQGNAVILSEAKNLVVKFSGNRAWVQDENGNKLAEAVLKGNTIKIDNLVTGHHVDMKLGRYGIENITETNGRGLVVRTESYKYDAKNRTYTYSIHDTEPTTIETSQGSKTVKGKGTYVANGVVKYDSKNRIIASEENKILKSGNKTIYSYHDKLENVTFDKVGNTVNFHKETSEKGMGIKKYSTTIDRAGTVDDKGLLNYYKETEHTKVKGSKISRTYEAHPEYGANNVLIDEHREMTSEKVKSSGGFLKKFLMPAISIALGIILAPVTAGISTMLTTSFALGATAATALATGITAFASSFLTSIAMGAKPMDALKGALVSGLAAGIGSGIFPGAGLPSLDNFSIMKQIVKPILTSVAFNTVSEEIGGTVGVVTATIGTGLVNTAFGGTPTRADFIVKTLGSTALTVATETMRRDDGSMPLWVSGLQGFVGTAINNFNGAKFEHNLNAMNLRTEGSSLTKDTRGYITGETTTDTITGETTIRRFDGQKFSDPYTVPANVDKVEGVGYLTGASGVAFIPTLEATGSIVYENGKTNYYDNQGNFTVSIPDNQIPIYDNQGQLIGTKLPLSMMTLGMGQDILFNPITQKGQTSTAMGLVPMGATLRTENNQVIGSQLTDQNGNVTLYRLNGIKEAQLNTDGSLISYDSRGETSYRVAPDGRMASYTYAGDPIILNPTTEVDHDSLGNLVLRESNNAYRIYDAQTDLLTEASDGKSKIRIYEYDSQNRLYGIVEDDLIQQRQNLYGADGELVFTSKTGDTIVENVYGEAAGSLHISKDYDGIEMREWSDAQGNRAPVEEMEQLYGKIYQAGKDNVIKAFDGGRKAVYSLIEGSPIEVPIVKIIAGVKFGSNAPGWKNYLEGLPREVSINDPQPELMNRMGYSKFLSRSIPAYLFGDSESEYGIAYPSLSVELKNTKNVFTFTPGVGNDAKSTYESAKRMANKVGQPVFYVVNPSHKDDSMKTQIPFYLPGTPFKLFQIETERKGVVIGVAQDVVQSAAQKLFKMPDATTSALFGLHQNIFKNAPENTRIIHTAHSQADIITTNEASYLREKELKRINYISLGGASHSDPGFDTVDPYANTLDPIAHLLGKGAIMTVTHLPMYAYSSIFGSESERPLLEYTPGYGLGHAFTSYDESLNEALDKLDYPRNKGK